MPVTLVEWTTKVTDFLSTPVTYGTLCVLWLGWFLGSFIIIFARAWNQKRKFNNNVTAVKNAVQNSNPGFDEIEIQQGTKIQTWKWEDGEWILKQI